MDATRATDPDTGSAREDLLHLATALVDGLSWVVLAVHAEARRVPGLVDGFLADRHALVDRVVRRGVARGELRADADPELVRDLLFGPLVYHWLATGEPRSPDTVFDVVWPLFRVGPAVSATPPGPTAPR
ncbi:TetR-like C-terminal domain-containing protein [Saccharothrix isguenensis]